MKDRVKEEFETAEKLEKYKNMFNSVRAFATENKWLALIALEENDEYYPEFTYLTPTGTVVTVSFDEEGLIIDGTTIS